MCPAELYAAYPDARFILTTRDPPKWETSIRTTVKPLLEFLRQDKDRGPLRDGLIAWTEKTNSYNRTQQDLLDHNERVKQIIPADKLLVYEVGEGWDRLVEFLNVPKPSIPFPHVNDAAQFQEIVQARDTELAASP
ncbi:hypothetical protein K439DRAFT_979213 [Ramaria rubella]|nr:hypothetical protein K439DRAFT_979213 [Ramaria rubella]